MEGVWVKTSTPNVLVKTGAHLRNLPPLFSPSLTNIFSKFASEDVPLFLPTTRKSDHKAGRRQSNCVASHVFLRSADWSIAPAHFRKARGPKSEAMATIEDRYEYKTNEMPAMACRKWGHPQRFTSDSLQLTAFQSCVCVPSKIQKKSASNSFKDCQANLPHQGPPSAARSAGHEAESAPTSTELNQKSIASNPSSSKTVPFSQKRTQNPWSNMLLNTISSSQDPLGLGSTSSCQTPNASWFVAVHTSKARTMKHLIVLPGLASPSKTHLPCWASVQRSADRPHRAEFTWPRVPSAAACALWS